MTLKIGDKNNPIIKAVDEFLTPYGFKKKRGCYWVLEQEEVILTCLLDHYHKRYDVVFYLWIKGLAEYFVGTPKFFEDTFDPKHEYFGHISFGLDVPRSQAKEDWAIFSDDENVILDEERIAKIKEYMANYGMDLFWQCRTEAGIRKAILEKREGFGYNWLGSWVRQYFKSAAESGQCYAIYLHDNYYAICQTITYEEDDSHGYYGMVFFAQPFLCDDLNDRERYYENKKQVEDIVGYGPCSYVEIVIPESGCGENAEIYELDWRTKWKYVCELRATILPEDFKTLTISNRSLLSEDEAIKFVMAYNGLLPWDLYPEDPTKFDRLLLHPDQKPAAIKYRKDFIEQPDGSFVLKDK